MPGPLYPNVPKSEGVPPVRRDDANSTTPTEEPLTKDSASVDRAAAEQWGIYLNGEMALKPDNITAIGFSGEYRLADYPIEGGDLETYDKVMLPFDVRVLITKGGSLADRQAFLKAVEKMRGDRLLYDIVTPEATYQSVNVERVTLNRSADNGATLLSVELGLRQIRQTVNAQTSTAKSPASAAPVNNGSVQTRANTNNPGAIR